MINNIELLMWGVSAAAFTATIANIHKKRWCFHVWILTNAAQALYTFGKGAYPTAALSLAYLGLAIWGAVKWR